MDKDLKEIYEMQFKVLALMGNWINKNNMNLDQEFKHRVFKNIEYIKSVDSLLFMENELNRIKNKIK